MILTSAQYWVYIETRNYVGDHVDTHRIQAWNEDGDPMVIGDRGLITAQQHVGATPGIAEYTLAERTI